MKPIVITLKNNTNKNNPYTQTIKQSTTFPIITNSGYQQSTSVYIDTIKSSSLSKDEKDFLTWHKRLGYISMGKIKLLARLGFITNTNISKVKRNLIFMNYAYGKAHKIPVEKANISAMNNK